MPQAGRRVSVVLLSYSAAAGLGRNVLAGDGTAEVGSRGDTGEVVVRIDPRYFRPAEVETLLGDPSKAKEKLGWTPKTTLEELVAEMVAIDVEEAERGLSQEQGLCCGGCTRVNLINHNDRLAILEPGYGR